MRLIYLIVLCIGLSIPINLNAQTDFFTEHPIRVSVFTHTIGLPFRKMIHKPFNWGISIGTEITYGQNNNNWFQGIQLGWYSHKHIGPGVFVKTDFNYRYRSAGGWFGGGGLGIGYLRYFSPVEQFEVNENGVYERAANLGLNSFLFGINLDTGFQPTQDNSWNAAPFLRYDYFIQTPFSEEVPFFPHALLHLGGHFQKSE